MLPILKRINELSRKSKRDGLSEAEVAEQARLRKEYLQTFRGSIRSTLLSVTIVDPNGNDVTPDKLKNEQNRGDSPRGDHHILH
ncbi:DUF896 domain-containing protein [Paenibacillus filicis]|uniref:UPF0291 protein O9H85_15135 n=1 Tax=Paenibacillus gyeongsangnamensis TaxID=3388067 RepID=A0ABT4QAE2_9BACL|nr:DUF896 domain-containing protein [Paenibacillus filicis]MCZ8513741.1 DUF896 domain-containing protein [Paenibacillus filicis]